MTINKPLGALPDLASLLAQSPPSPQHPMNRNPMGQGGFKPGQSGNPGGMSKSAGEIKKLARQYSHQAIMTLVSICDDADAPAAARAWLSKGRW